MQSRDDDLRMRSLQESTWKSIPYLFLATFTALFILMFVAGPLRLRFLIFDCGSYVGPALRAHNPLYAFSTTVQFFPRPLVHLYTYFVVNIFGSTQVALHIANSILFILTVQLLAAISSRLLKSRWWGITSAALAVPLMSYHSETIYFFTAGATGYLCTLFYLLTMLAYIRVRDRGRKRCKVMVVIFFTAALLAKETAVTLLPMLILLEIVLRAPGKRPIRLFIVLSIILFVYAAWEILTQSQVAAALPTGAGGNLARYGLFTGKLMANLWQIPVFLISWVVPPLNTLSPNPLSLLSVLALCITATFVRGVDHRPIYFGLGWILITDLVFIPWGYLVIRDAARYLLLPSMGFALMMGASLRSLLSGLPKRVSVVIVLVILLNLTVLHGMELSRAWIHFRF